MFTPPQVHFDLAQENYAQGAAMLQEAFSAMRQRFKGKTPKSLALHEAVWVNKSENGSNLQ